MMFRRRLLMGLLVLFTGLQASGTGLAQSLPQVSMLVIDSARIMREALAANSIGEQVAVYREVYLKQTTKEERVLLKKQKRLQQQRKTLAKEAFAVQLKKYNRQKIKLTRTVQERSARLATVSQRAVLQLNKTLIKIVQGVALKKKANIVIDRNKAVFYAKAMDITEAVLKSLNKSLKTVKVQDPAKIK